LLANYDFVGLFLVVTILFPVIAVGLAYFLRPKKPTPIKTATYECGLETTGETWVQFKAQYYLYALVFVVFDVEAVFLYPWAVAYNRLGLYALAEMVVFLAILVLGLAYAWRKKALSWM
jgi:NADH-quinone oxidoreductase subunit A